TPLPTTRTIRTTRTRILPDHLPVHAEHHARGRAVAEVLVVLQLPDHLLVAGNLDELRVLRAGVAVADDHVAVGQPLEHRDPRERDAGEFLLFDAPDGLAVLGDLDRPVGVAAADQ